MAIVDLQRRLKELGRLRMGHLVPGKKPGSKRPEKLTVWRMTSPRKELLDAAADLWGGEVQVWEGAPGGQQFEIITETSSIPVAMYPGEMMSQFYELWTGGGCKRRCDGRRQVKVDRACVCPEDLGERMAAAQEGEACMPYTRVSFLVPEIKDLGTWRLETKGYFAAAEIPGLFEICQKATSEGRIIPAHLRIEERQSVKDGLTRNFIVPVVDIDFGIAEAVAALTGQTLADLPVLMPPVEQRSLPGPKPGLSTDPEVIDAEVVSGPVVEEASMPGQAPPPGEAEPSPLPEWVLDLPGEDPEIIDAINVVLHEMGKKAVVDSLRDRRLEDPSEEFREAVRSRLSVEVPG